MAPCFKRVSIQRPDCIRSWIGNPEISGQLKPSLVQEWMMKKSEDRNAVAGANGSHSRAPKNSEKNGSICCC